MGSGRKVSVFSTYKPLLRILTIYDWKNFQNQKRPTLTRNICQAIAISVLVLAFIVAFVCDVMHCLNHHFHVTQIALPLGLLIGSTQFALTFASIRMKDDLVNTVINDLHKIVMKRK